MTPRVFFKLALAALWTLGLLPWQMMALALRWRGLAEAVPQLYHRGLARIIGLKVRVHGAPILDRPALYVANHVSWLDIIVFDNVVKACFVAKMDIAEWPIFGTLAKLQRTVFVERRAARTRDHAQDMQARLRAGDRLILFAEGTSHDGIRVLPFKSSFFSLAEERVGDEPLQVQPVTLAYTRLNNLPSGRRFAATFAWIGDEELGPHLFRFLQSLTSEVQVIFHPPLTIQEFGSRKALAQACEVKVRQGLSDALAGRLNAPTMPATHRPAAALAA